MGPLNDTYDTFTSYRCLTDVDLRVFAIRDIYVQSVSLTPFHFSAKNNVNKYNIELYFANNPADDHIFVYILIDVLFISFIANIQYASGTHWNKMATIEQKALSNALSWITIIVLASDRRHAVTSAIVDRHMWHYIISLSNNVLNAIWRETVNSWQIFRPCLYRYWVCKVHLQQCYEDNLEIPSWWRTQIIKSLLSNITASHVGPVSNQLLNWPQDSYNPLVQKPLGPPSCNEPSGGKR